MKWLRLLVWLMLAAASGAQAQIAFRGATQAASAAGTASTLSFVQSDTSEGQGTQVTLTLPNNAQAGDVVIAVIAVEDETAASVTAPAAFSPIRGDNAGNHTQIIAYRVVTAADEAGSPSWSWSWGGTEDFAAALLVFRGVDTSAPIDVHAGTPTNTNNTTTIDIPSVTPTVSNTLLVLAASIRSGSQFGPWSGGATERTDRRSGTGGDEVGLGTATDPGPAAGVSSGGYTVTANNNDTSRVGALLALRPAGAGSPLTINVPAGTVANDVMIASITMRPCSNSSGGACTTTINEPSGWTQVGTTIDQTTGAGTGGFGHRLAMYRRIASGAEPASYTWSFGGTPVHAGAAGAILSFSGVDTTNPIVANAGVTTTAQRDHVAPTVDTGTVTDTMLVNVYSVNSSGAWTSTTGTEQADIASLPTPDDLGLALGVYTESIAAAGPTGTRTGRQPLAPNPAYDTGATYSLALRPGSTVAHYSIGASATTVANCDYVEVAIVGHDATHTPINVPSSRTVTLTTSTGTGVWQAGLVSGTGTWLPSGSNNGTATYNWPGGESGFTVRLRQSAVTSLSVNLNDGTVTEGTGSEDPTISFVNSAFRISNGSNAALAIGTQIAGKPSDTGFGAQALFLQAIRTDTNTGACVSLFPKGGDVSVDVRAQCNNPATCTQNLSINSSAAASNSRTFVPGTAFGAMNFRFTTDNGEAPFVLSYADAGQLTLEFRAALPSPPANQLVQGTSNAFVTRPFGFRITGANSATPLVTSATPAPADPVLAAAGANFNVTMTAVQWKAGDDTALPAPDGVPDSEAQIAGNAVTPNFGQEAVAASVALTHSLNAPAAGDPGTLGGSTTFSGFAAGTKTQAVSWSEVGFINLVATTTAPYLGTVIVTDSATGLTGVGRFKPADFAVATSGPVLPTLTNRFAAACSPASTFSYMDEGMGIKFRLEARNSAGNRTLNYTGAYARLDTIAELRLDAVSGTTNLGARLDTTAIPAPGFANGRYDVDTTIILKRRSPDDPDGPFPNMSIGIAPTDEDSTALQNPVLDIDVDGAGGNDHQRIGGATQIRFGRLRMENRVGSEKLALPVQIETQYWNGNGFFTNTLDSCTSIARSAIILGGYTGPIDPANPAAPGCKTFVQEDPIVFSSGLGTLTLAQPANVPPPPGVPATGSVLLTVNLGPAAVPGSKYCTGVAPEQNAGVATRRYLLGRWNDAGTTEGPDDPATRHDDNPSARAAFGLFGGQPNNFIYFRENY